MKNIKVYTQTRRYVRTTAFASGLVFSDSYSDAALCMSMRSQARHSGSLIDVLDAFLGMTSSTSGGRDAHVMEQRLLLCGIEKRFVGLSYRFLFMHSVLKQHILPIGLYRSPQQVDPHYSGTSSTPPPNLPYVYTNPHPDTTINAGDRVYILKPESTENIDNNFKHTYRQRQSISRSKRGEKMHRSVNSFSKEFVQGQLETMIHRLQREMYMKAT